MSTTPQQPSAAKVWVGLISGLAVAGSLVLGVWAAVDGVPKAIIDSNAQATVGTVVDVERKQTRSNNRIKTTYKAVVEYAVDGETYVVKGPSTDSPSTVSGDEVDVVFKADQHNFSYIKPEYNDWQTTTQIMSVLAGVLFVGGGIPISVMIIQSRKKKKLNSTAS